MNNYRIYKISAYNFNKDKIDDRFFITHSRQLLDKRKSTIKRNAIHGSNGDMYDFIRELGPENFYMEELYDKNTYCNFQLSLEEVKDKCIYIKEREKNKAILIYEEEILILDDDIRELRENAASVIVTSKDDSASLKKRDDFMKFVNEDKEKIKNLLERIEVISNF